MAGFQLDQNVPIQLRALLRAGGHDVVDAREQGLTRASDADLLLEAALAGRMMITHDLDDFRLLQRAWRRWPVAWGMSSLPAHAGILIVPQPPRVTPIALARAIEELLVASMPLANRLWRWEPTTGWSVEPTRPDESALDQ